VGIITKATRLREPENETILQGISYHSFINAIRSPATKKGYENSLIRYCKYLKLKNIDDLLLHSSNPKFIESQIIDFIMSLRQDGVSYATIKFLVSPIFTFYQLNDVLLNRKKVSRYLGEFKRVVKDQAYTAEQIQTALQNADIRMRMIILILASAGCRVGSLPSLTLGDITRKPDYGLYRIVFYEGTNNEYYTYCTRECAKTGIDNYLLYRQRAGEKISFNENTNRWEPDNTPLIRLQFDINDMFQVKRPKPMTLTGLRIALYNHLIRSGLRQIEHLTEANNKNNNSSCNSIRKAVPIFNGFRKHVISTFIECQLSHEIRELIVDHDTHLDANYYRPSEEQVLNEYLKAEPFLTIDPNVRLLNENKVLKIRADKVDGVLEEIAELKRSLGLT
jgi:integrase